MCQDDTKWLRGTGLAPSYLPEDAELSSRCLICLAPPFSVFSDALRQSRPRFSVLHLKIRRAETKQEEISEQQLAMLPKHTAGDGQPREAS